MTNEVTIHGLALCAGTGAIELGLKMLLGDAYVTVGYVERELAVVEVLARRMEEGHLDRAPVWDDLRTFNSEPYRRRVDLVTAGFPCQPFSTASRGRRVADDLWPEVLRVFCETDAPVGFFENVQRGPIERAAADLDRLGYRCLATDACPSRLGSASPRVRYWLLAYRDDALQSGLTLDAQVAGLPETPCAHPWQDPSGVLGMDPRPPGRMDRMRAVGNGVVPLVAAYVFIVLARAAGLTRCG